MGILPGRFLAFGNSPQFDVGSSPMRLERLLWMFPVAVTLHNLEEAVWLPAWSQHAGIWEQPVGAREFRVAAVLLAIFAYAVTYWSIRTGQEGVGTYVITGFLFAMLLNVIYHVAATLSLREFAPGILTAVLINLPVMGYLLWRMFQERWVTWPKALVAFIAIPPAILLLIPVLFWIGRTI
ncbi:MAG TPA: HXXEE domain-containing protein [Candidatus Acidoferrum sp.]|nr:HXXEE domain-containing protein [Candidatus Acidoferrum sp.]